MLGLDGEALGYFSPGEFEDNWPLARIRAFPRVGVQRTLNLTVTGRNVSVTINGT